jgi:hypothetical protein
MADRDIMMTSGNCVAITFHDEDLVADFARRIGKKVILFPEIADLSVPEKSYPLELLIQKLARGRVVVGNIGLEKHKGNYEFMQLAKFANPDQYFFVFTGRDDGTLFQFLKEGQTDEFKHFISQLPENCIWAPAHFEDELEYNAVVAAFDILYMIYTHFYGSSNRLTKAVFFQKPVLADAQYCIGNTVKKYRLGEVVPDTRPETLLTALEKLKERLGQQAISEHDRQTYLQQNSAGVLTERFRELLELI